MRCRITCLSYSRFSGHAEIVKRILGIVLFATPIYQRSFVLSTIANPYKILPPYPPTIRLRPASLAAPDRACTRPTIFACWDRQPFSPYLLHSHRPRTQNSGTGICPYDKSNSCGCGMLRSSAIHPLKHTESTGFSGASVFFDVRYRIEKRFYIGRMDIGQNGFVTWRDNQPRWKQFF